MELGLAKLATELFKNSGSITFVEVPDPNSNTSINDTLEILIHKAHAVQSTNSLNLTHFQSRIGKQDVTRHQAKK